MLLRKDAEKAVNSQKFVAFLKSEPTLKDVNECIGLIIPRSKPYKTDRLFKHKS